MWELEILNVCNSRWPPFYLFLLTWRVIESKPHAGLTHLLREFLSSVVMGQARPMIWSQFGFVLSFQPIWSHRELLSFFFLLIKCVIGWWNSGSSMHMVLANPSWAELPSFATTPINHFLLFFFVLFSPKIASPAISEGLSSGALWSHVANERVLGTPFPYYSDTLINGAAANWHSLIGHIYDAYRLWVRSMGQEW